MKIHKHLMSLILQETKVPNIVNILSVKNLSFYITIKNTKQNSNLYDTLKSTEQLGKLKNIYC